MIIKLEKAYKSYGKTKILNGVNFYLEKGEIIGILGDNGAGKSTLIKSLSGLEKFDKADFYINSKRVDTKNYNVKKARKFGFETVYQDSSLGLNQEIYRNIFLGRDIVNFFGFINIKKEKNESIKVLQNFLGLRGAGLSPTSKVKSLSGGERQGLAIARAVYFDAKVVILDEPTTALATKEAKKVLDFIKSLPSLGKSAILITHNLYHAYEVCTRFVMINHGKIVANVQKKDISLDELQDRFFKLAC